MHCIALDQTECKTPGLMIVGGLSPIMGFLGWMATASDIALDPFLGGLFGFLSAYGLYRLTSWRQSEERKRSMLRGIRIELQQNLRNLEDGTRPQDNLRANEFYTHHGARLTTDAFIVFRGTGEYHELAPQTRDVIQKAYRRLRYVERLERSIFYLSISPERVNQQRAVNLTNGLSRHLKTVQEDVQPAIDAITEEVGEGG